MIKDDIMAIATTIRTRTKTETKMILLSPNTVAFGGPGKGVIIDEGLLRDIDAKFRDINTETLRGAKLIGRYHRN